MKKLLRRLLALCVIASPAAQAQLSPTPTNVIDWETGYIATYEAVIQKSDVTNGVLQEWRVEVSNRGDSVLEMAWMESGYRADISSYEDKGLFVLTNKGQDFIRPLNAGDVIAFSVLGRDIGYKEGDLSLRFVTSETITDNPSVEGYKTAAKFTGVNDWFNPAWGGGYIASFECDITPNATDVRVEFNYTGSGKPGLSWPDNWFGVTTSGYLGESGGFALVTTGEKTTDPAITAAFSILVDESGFSKSDFNVACISSSEKGTVKPPVNLPSCLINGVDVETGIKQSECDALVSIYNATNGPSWDVQADWLTATDPCTWYGVSCEVDASGAQYVDVLNLQLNRLSGQVPEDILNLTNLRQLYLGSNDLDSIPSYLGQLSTLQTFQHGVVTGPIPVELGNLTELRDFSLIVEQGSEPFPTWLTSLPQLESLLLRGRGFTGSIPAEVGNLTNLRSLFIIGTQFTGGLPAELGSLSSLAQLVIDDNPLGGAIPIELGNLTFTRGSISLQNNQLTGPIPPQLGNIPGLEFIDLSENELSGSIPVEFALNPALKSLVLYDNQLTGQIPVEFGQAANIFTLELQSNQLFGDVSFLRELTAPRPAPRSIFLFNNGCFTADSITASQLDTIDRNWQDGC